MKTQTIRLLDVFFIGPWMIRAGWRLADWVLVGLGVATIWYNLANWHRVRSGTPDV